MTRLLLATYLGLLLVNPWSTIRQASPVYSTLPLPQELQPRAWFPVSMKAWGRYPSTSNYMSTVDSQTLYYLGCTQGMATPNNTSIVVILGFGQPWHDDADNSYGALIFGNNGYRTTSSIEDAARGYVSGYYACSSSGSHLTLAIGVNNYGPASEVSYDHGAAWSEMIKTLISWVRTPPDYSGRISIRGALDAEAGWNSAATTKNWIDGYREHVDYVNYANFYYDFGSCDGCPVSIVDVSSQDPNVSNPITTGDWRLDDQWYVASNTAAFPLPEIYLRNGTNATQWYVMSRYANDKHGFLMYFRGAMTQWGACQYNAAHGDYTCINNYLDNTPSAGWEQLQSALNQDSATALPLDWSTDITWEN